MAVRLRCTVRGAHAFNEHHDDGLVERSAIVYGPCVQYTPIPNIYTYKQPFVYICVQILSGIAFHLRARIHTRSRTARPQPNREYVYDEYNECSSVAQRVRWRTSKRGKKYRLPVNEYIIRAYVRAYTAQKLHENHAEHIAH